VNAVPSIKRLDAADTATASNLVDVHHAALAVDEPASQRWSPRVTLIRLTLGWPVRDPSEVWWIAGDVPGGVAGGYQLYLPDLENPQLARLDLFVHPAARQRGLGTALLRHAAQRASGNGRSRMHGSVVQGSAGEAFARQAGATIGLADVCRVLDVSRVPVQHFARCRDQAAAAADGYSLVSWSGQTPQQYLTSVAAMNTAFVDAPNMPNAEPQAWDSRRVRERVNGWIEAAGFRAYQVAAVCDATGEMAGLTEVRIDPDAPDWGSQSGTVVARSHRGHRLGMLLKATMLQWLAEEEPQLERIVTHNAASNSPMIAINEELGFAVSGQPQREVELTVAG
jgi:GNAT superfamily N-acetyltransferase